MTNNEHTVHIVVERGADIAPLLQDLPSTTRVSAFFLHAADYHEDLELEQWWIASESDLLQKNTDRFELAVLRAGELTDKLLNIAKEILK